MNKWSKPKAYLLDHIKLSLSSPQCSIVALPNINMSTPTRSNPLEHVLLSVLKATTSEHPIRRAFYDAGVLSIDDMLDLSKDDLKDISWSENGFTKPLSITQVNSILAIGAWFRTEESTDDAVPVPDPKTGVLLLLHPLLCLFLPLVPKWIQQSLSFACPSCPDSSSFCYHHRWRCLCCWLYSPA